MAIIDLPKQGQANWGVDLNADLMALSEVGVVAEAARDEVLEVAANVANVVPADGTRAIGTGEVAVAVMGVVGPTTSDMATNLSALESVLGYKWGI
jgi:hypothetical protein